MVVEGGVAAFDASHASQRILGKDFLDNAVGDLSDLGKKTTLSEDHAHVCGRKRLADLFGGVRSDGWQSVANAVEGGR